jgi:hypothetical protein
MDLTAPLDSAIDAATRLRSTLAKGSSPQVRSADERLLIKATAQAWFRSQKPLLARPGSDALLDQVDQQFVDLLESAEQHTTRAKYLQRLKGLKIDLVKLRSKVVLVGANRDWQKPDFALLISDALMLAILEHRWVETLACLNASAPLAATVMMGGLLEALFLARINGLADKATVFTTSVAPRDKLGKAKGLKDWGLKDYLDVAHELGWIRQSAKDVGQVLRDYRNYVHPEKERSHGVSLNDADASMFLTVFCSVAEQIIAP